MIEFRDYTTNQIILLFGKPIMADKEKNLPEVDNWTKNAEEHGRLAADLAAQAARLEMLTQTFNKLERRFEKLEAGQTDLRKELVGQINETNKKIAETNKEIAETNKKIYDINKRVDDLRTEMINQFSSLKDEARQDRETFRKEIRADRLWLIGTTITVVALVVAIVQYLSG